MAMNENTKKLLEQMREDLAGKAIPTKELIDMETVHSMLNCLKDFSETILEGIQSDDEYKRAASLYLLSMLTRFMVESGIMTINSNEMAEH